ncbi:putative capsid decoration protein [Klebsiella phage vB_KpnD_PeteCarol]|uniref:Capsid decoration protein n=1 Tax=Klebsiella phage vB_KpnD_PeteCarol TaxID=2902681 RepID=A0AC61TQB4_9CAUD|nr:putative capsid decoration protein [Klebsiella phage vB_KpnD_PeteCarol]
MVRFLRGTCLFSMDFAPDFSWIFTYRDLTILPICINSMKCMEKIT